MLNRQVLRQFCAECDAEFTVVRGSVFDGGEPFGLYLIALHGHSPDGLLGHAAIGLLDRSNDEPLPLAAAIQIVATMSQFGFSFVEWPQSPWLNETYLGRLLSPEELRLSSHRELFLHVAEHVVGDLPEAQTYFAATT